MFYDYVTTFKSFSSNLANKIRRLYLMEEEEEEEERAELFKR